MWIDVSIDHPTRSLVLMRKGDDGWSLVDLRGSDPMGTKVQLAEQMGEEM